MKNKFNTNVLKRHNFLAIVFAAVIGFSFFACGEPANTNNDGTKPDNEVDTTPTYGEKESSKYPGFFYVDEGDTITITKYENKSGNRDITIPSEIDGKPVTSIGQLAFSDCTGLTSITIPASVTEIGWDIFRGCTSLTAINVNAANTEYSSSDGVIYNKDKTELIRCPQAKTGAFTIPDSVTMFWARAFEGCAGLTAITIPDSVKEINNSFFYAFEDLNSQVNITWYNPTGKGEAFSKGYLTVIISDGVTSIGISAFAGCTGLTGITIPSSVTSIGDNAFYGCTGLTGITIPSSVTSIGREAFKDCTGLTSITIPSSVTSIGNLVIFGCTGLTSITIDSGVFNFRDSDYGFFINPGNKYPNLTAINVNAANTEYSSEDGVIYNKDKTVLIWYPKAKTGDFIIPDSVTDAWGAFEDCIGLTGITIPANARVTLQEYVFIDNYNHYSHGFSEAIPFPGCINLTAINVDPANKIFKSINGVLYNKPPYEGNKPLYEGENYSVLLQCPQAKTGAFTIPDNVTNIAIRAFEDCAGLTSVTIPDSVTEIGWMAFKGCTSLIKVWFKGTISIDNFGYYYSNWPWQEKQSFIGDLKDKFYANDSTDGTPGIYFTTKPVNEDSKWGLLYIGGTYSNYNNTASFYLKSDGDFVYYNGFSMTYPGTWSFSGETIYTPLGVFTVIDGSTIYNSTWGTWHRER